LDEWRLRADKPLIVLPSRQLAVAEEIAETVPVLNWAYWSAII